ncbi:flagellar motor protein MotA [Sulfurimonas aquatica]|uniref:Flagellar motor protein MotA n=1 Tax=Sulfurimonas aquatica TaxID=2672570 RepID=A0A975B1W2_9BACT|nr:MotA/TolQ/ExbB proton channel family protein [Sulfurimonas aquatica]QSZ42716.1 flagellar motor protein MotA [Sulfurimonas aquatica]
MKILTLIFLMAFSLLNADELSNAYQKEFTFLKAQKSELQTRLKKEKSFQKKELAKAKAKVQSLQNKLVTLSQTNETIAKQIDKSALMLEDKNSNKQISSSVVIQAKSLLGEYAIAVNDTKDMDVVAVMDKAFKETSSLYKKLSSVQTTKGKFYLVDGTTAEGEIVKVGNIAAYGMSSNAKGALAPAGNGEYKVWNKDTTADALAFATAQPKRDVKIFIYENLDKDIEYTKEKSIEETLAGGGTIGYIILALGALGVLLILARIFLLAKSGSNVKEITDVVISKVEAGQAHEALEAIKSYKGATARVIKATLRNIDKERDHIEDIVTENILNESSNIDRFGNFVLVLAAVAPLLGLLGTVTGMIATFDIITTHGTGDPKLLSGGISEALVTTMLGLVVAIPLLLLGNLMSGWAQSIKDSMEQSALHIVNLFEINKA